ncbi:MAG: aminotransferase class I/II-fold pyridoxal phosphate-dependent enzyme [Kiritimatiellaeota bacterium]|nr:aminotransferase class I/II-fold pyridoxal phosphate-dependent enzyme [Kiritimatiellota bacterium]
MDLFRKCLAYTAVQEVKAAGIYPYFHELMSKQDSVVTMEGRRMIMAGSNNYLGLTSHPEVIAAAVRATEQFGSGVSGSRFLNGTLSLHRELERDLAAFLGKEDVLTFSTGYQANLGILSCIAGRNDVILCDKENHASIYDGCRLSFAEMARYRHNDMADLEACLRNIPDSKGRLIVTDGVFSMSGDICNLPEVVRLAKAYGARVMVDDAHGLGVLGKTGRGTPEHFGLADEVDIVMGTFSKSFASLGGFMASTAAAVDYVRHTSRPLIFCAAVPPSNAAATREAMRILQREPERLTALLDIAQYVRDGLRARGVAIRESATPIVPIYTGEVERTLRVCCALFERGVYVNPVIPPATPPGECLARISCTAIHTRPLMDEAMDIIAQTLKDV